MAVDVRRKVPSVDALLRSDPARRAASSLGRPLLKRMLEDVLEEVRAAAARGEDPPPDEILLARALGRASHAAQGMVPVINATGVILHTNLGRAPLPERAARAAARAARNYTDIEVDRETGRRGKRGRHAEILLTALTGAEAAMVVNNCAAALLLAMATLAKGKQVLVSRGELIEIGGEFRIPDILAASGARLAEVGTTNRTRIGDYRAASGDKTGLILKVHPSNYRMVGFTAAPSATDLSGLARKLGIPFLFDVGSGLLHHGHGHPGRRAERVRRARPGSGPRHVLGGQAARRTAGGHPRRTGRSLGPVAPAPDRPCRPHRTDADGGTRTGPRDHRRRPGGGAPRVPHAPRLARDGPDPRPDPVRDDRRGARGSARRALRVGGRRGFDARAGELPSWGVRIRVPDAPAFAARLRTGTPAAFSRVEDGFVLLDCRTVTDEQLPHLARAVHYALEGDEEHGHDLHGDDRQGSDATGATTTTSTSR